MKRETLYPLVGESTTFPFTSLQYVTGQSSSSQLAGT